MDPDKITRYRSLTKFAGVIATVALTTCAGGCFSKVVRLENDPAYLAVRSRVFTLKRDAYLFREAEGERKNEIFIGCISDTPGIHITEFPARLDPSLVGTRYRDFLILSIVPKGTTFRIVALKRIEDLVDKMTSFEIVIGGNLGNFGVIDGLWLTDRRHGAPKIYEELAEDGLKR